MKTYLKHMVNRVSRFLTNLCGVAFVFCGVLSGAEPENLEALFLKATTNTGRQYADIRTAIFQAPVGLEEFLRDQQKSAATADARWLAEILLARLTQREAFKELEQEFHEKVFLYYHTYPDRSRTLGSHPGHLGGLLIPGESLPGDQEGYPRWDSIESLWGDLAPRVREYWELLRVRKSPLWSPLCGEILMKGWVPEECIHDPRPQVFPVRSSKTRLCDLEYLSQAMNLLGKLGESRAGPRAIATLQDPQQEQALRATAALCLGNLKYVSALPQLLKLCESSGTLNGTMASITKPTKPADVPFGLYQVICEVLVQIGDQSVIPEMQRISKELDAQGDKAPTPGVTLNDVPGSAVHRAMFLATAADNLKKKKSID